MNYSAVRVQKIFPNSPHSVSVLLSFRHKPLSWLLYLCKFLGLYMWMSVLLFVSCSWSFLLSISPTYPPVCPSIYHQLIHYPVQLRSGPNLASRPYLCTVSCTWQLTVLRILFFIRWLCCCLTFLAVRGALAVDFSYITCQCFKLKFNMAHFKWGQCHLVNSLQ